MSIHVNRCYRIIAVLLIGLISGGCDGALSPSDHAPTDRSESDYNVQAYARDVSAILEGSIDRISNLSPEQISSLRASAHELRKALRQKDRKAIVKAKEEVKNTLKSTIFTDNELEKMRKYARRMYYSNQHLIQYNDKKLRSKINEAFQNVLQKEKGLKNTTDCDYNCAVTFSSSAGFSVASGVAALIACGATGPGFGLCVATALGTQYGGIAVAAANFAYCLSNCP